MSLAFRFGTVDGGACFALYGFLGSDTLTSFIPAFGFAGAARP